MSEYIVPPRLRIVVAAILSIALHLALIFFAPKPPDHPMQTASIPGPLTVTIEKPAPSLATSAPSAPPPPQQRPEPRQIPRPLITARPHTRSPETTPPPEAPQPVPAPPPVPTPSVDMLAMINARRAQRRAAEAEREHEGESEGNPGANLNGTEKGMSAIQRNLDTLKDEDHTGGVFQIITQETYTAEYVFNGWRPDTHRRWREMIEVKAKPGEGIELAIVRSMIALIRGHYQGDFQWESHRLGKVVTLSARLEDNQALEDFLVREFWGVPVLKRPADR